MTALRVLLVDDHPAFATSARALVEVHVRSIFDKLGLVESGEVNRRVAAVLTYLGVRLEL